MQQVSSTTRRTRRRPGLRLLLQNLGRLPLVTAASLYRWFDPGFWLEREARCVVGDWLTLQRSRQLERIAGRLSTRQCMLLAYLASKAPVGDLVHVGQWESQATAWLAEGVRQRSDRPRIVSIQAEGRDSWHEPADVARRFDWQSQQLKIYRLRLQDVDPGFGRPIALLWLDDSRGGAEPGQNTRQFLPSVVRGGWAVCVSADAKTARPAHSAANNGFGSKGGFRRVATIRQIEIFRRES